MNSHNKWWHLAFKDAKETLMVWMNGPQSRYCHFQLCFKDLLSFCASLFAVLKGRVRHHGSVRSQDGQHAHVLLRFSARLLHHSILPCSDQQPVCPAAAAPASGAPHGPAGSLLLDQVRLHVQLRLRWGTWLSPRRWSRLYRARSGVLQECCMLVMADCHPQTSKPPFSDKLVQHRVKQRKQRKLVN